MTDKNHVLANLEQHWLWCERRFCIQDHEGSQGFRIDPPTQSLEPAWKNYPGTVHGWVSKTDTGPELSNGLCLLFSKYYTLKQVSMFGQGRFLCWGLSKRPLRIPSKHTSAFHFLCSVSVLPPLFSFLCPFSVTRPWLQSRPPRLHAWVACMHFPVVFSPLTAHFLLHPAAFSFYLLACHWLLAKLHGNCYFSICMAATLFLSYNIIRMFSGSCGRWVQNPTADLRCYLSRFVYLSVH